MDVREDTVKRGFNNISSIYDTLAAIVFGKSIIRAQTMFLDKISENDRILIVGGGTGKILIELLVRKPAVTVDYIELSDGMIERAKNRLKTIGFDINVNFIQGTIDDLSVDKRYDVILTSCFIDMFTTSSAKDIIRRLNQQLNIEGIWLYSDFRNTDVWWQKKMLQLMYFFFRFVCGIEASHLPEIKKYFIHQGLLNLESKRFYHGMIEAVYYKKNKI